ncbi:MAG: DUF362 domain-containing protein [Kiritimatiellia bacterium]
MKISRRNFIKTAAAVTAAGSLLPRRLTAAEDGTVLYVAEGTDVKKMLETAIAEMGGWGAFVKKGQKATVKPNAAWVSRPEEGGNTDPALVGECVAACRKAGASEVVIPENPCSRPEKAFDISGIEKAATDAGGRMYCPRKGGHFRKTRIPRGRNFKEAEVVPDVLDTGCLINMPVAKTHSGATLTLSMKNWMGSVKNRGYLHRNNLHRCIADLSTLIKPTLIIMDATRIMVTGGPRGPGKLSYPNRIILGTDPVAVDAFSATLFGKKPFDVLHIKMAHEDGIGCGDLDKVKVVELKA